MQPAVFILLVFNFIVATCATIIPKTGKIISIFITRPRPHNVSEFSYSGFANSPEDFVDLHGKVMLSACDNGQDTSSLTYKWYFTEIVSRKSIGKAFESSSCDLQWKAPKLGTYTVKLELVHDENEVVGSAEKQFSVKDIWIVALGDSIMSGEGNPDKEGSLPTWIDESCHRSATSFAYQLQDKIARKYPKHGILFTFLACSGAEIKNGISGNEKFQSLFFSSKSEKTPPEPQLTVVSKIQDAISKKCNNDCSDCCKQKPDIILLNGGANDVRFGEIAVDLLSPVGGGISEDLDRINETLKALSSIYDKLQEATLTLGWDYRSIFFFEYLDTLRNEKEEVTVECMLWSGDLSAETYKKLDRDFREQLNDLIKKKCDQFNWWLVDGIDEAFSRHGICAQPYKEESWVRNFATSLVKQGDMKGTLHPNEKGHAKMVEISWTMIEPHLKTSISPVDAPTLTRTKADVATTTIQNPTHVLTSTSAPTEEPRLLRRKSCGSSVISNGLQILFLFAMTFQTAMF